MANPADSVAAATLSTDAISPECRSYVSFVPMMLLGGTMSSKAACTISSGAADTT